MIAWYHQGGNLIEIKGLRDKATKQLLDALSGVTVAATLYDEHGNEVAGPFDGDHVQDGDWQIVVPEADAPLELGRQYSLRLRIEGPGATGTRVVPLRVSWAGPDDV